ncbi:MAG: 50S ribosomal protein L35 [Candidatus Komeilibacteria bacterium CG_4_10_14_0_2_um_filter_37_10]|uniref:50S ribosomal protein L35 n=1 Tax=Candidatus Komeilibacteria bacterium CG_4_10_14_0_2_um_filter_37_10 TaxID=1974470 RepID=A0A2M7VF08_9BACT|nr:MAG: 50S ribosomal protein L35 [Candidatus Komeilibacteria bacterium CG_4_10_14_0_2_um_filter_37_10]PJA94291.1 MAG: 50S ribosomal protein L35 [Candidatus Komeilibacteria bacterium CG_4_9_14_3_um_filter_37_5]
MKLKTRKALVKRIKVTKNKKIKVRAGAQDHFNARQTGKKKRNKRRDINLAGVHRRAVIAGMPHNY